MTAEYERGFRDCIAIACLLCCQLRGPTNPEDFINTLHEKIQNNKCTEYKAGVSFALEKIRTVLGPTSIPLYPGDVHEIREVINRTSF